MEYAEIPALNWSTLHHIGQSPKMYQWRLQHPTPDSDALKLGRATHCALLEPERFEVEYAEEPDFGDCRYKENKERKKAWEAQRDPGVTFLDAKAITEARRIRDAIMGHRRASEAVSHGRAEEVIRWTDDSGLACKARIDLLQERSLVELKSTRHKSPRRFLSDAADRLYHAQVAWYFDGAIKAGALPADADCPLVVVAQTSEPWDVFVFRMGHEALEAGRNVYRSMLAKLDNCTAADWWPGAAPEILEFELPPWAAGASPLPAYDHDPFAEPEETENV